MISAQSHNAFAIHIYTECTCSLSHSGMVARMLTCRPDDHGFVSPLMIWKSDLGRCTNKRSWELVVASEILTTWPMLYSPHGSPDNPCYIDRMAHDILIAWPTGYWPHGPCYIDHMAHAIINTWPMRYWLQGLQDINHMVHDIFTTSPVIYLPHGLWDIGHISHWVPIGL